MEALILTVQGYVRMTQWGRAAAWPQLHAKHSTFPITLSHFPSPMPPSSNTHACTQNPHTAPVSGHSCFLTLTRRKRRLHFNQFGVSARLNYFLVVSNDNVYNVAIQSKWIFLLLDYMQSGISSLLFCMTQTALVSSLLSPLSSLSYISNYL